MWHKTPGVQTARCMPCPPQPACLGRLNCRPLTVFAPCSCPPVDRRARDRCLAFCDIACPPFAQRSFAYAAYNVRETQIIKWNTATAELVARIGTVLFLPVGIPSQSSPTLWSAEQIPPRSAYRMIPASPAAKTLKCQSQGVRVTRPFAASQPSTQLP